MTVDIDTPARATRPEGAAPAGASAPNRIARAASRAARTILGVLLLAMVALNVVNALGRYAMGTVIAGADEILVYTMVWLVMVGVILMTADLRHIALDFLVSNTGPRGRLALAILHHLAMAAASAYAAFQCWAFVQRVAEVGQTSMAIAIPMWIPHAALVAGFAGTAVVAVLLMVGDAAELLRGDRRRGGA